MSRFLLGIFVIFSFLCIPIFGMAETDMKTPKELKIIKNLQERKVVFLCFHKAQDANFEVIKDNLESVATNFKAIVQVIYVKGDDKAEGVLREKFKIISEQTVVFIIMPSGSATAKLEGVDITKTNLMRALYASCGSGSCSPSGCG